MMSKEHLNWITDCLRNNIWRNDNVAFCSKDLIDDEDIALMIDYISSLHNELYKAVTGEYYDYCWHWTNKIGAGDPEDKLFTDDPVENAKLFQRLAERVNNDDFA